MKRIIAIFILILAGCGILFYPHISNWLSEKNQSHAIQTFDNEVETFDEKELSEEWEQARIYNSSMESVVIKDPFVEGSGMALQDNYMELLNLDGVMGYIQIPKINVNLAIYHGTGEKSLKKGVGHLEGTSLPIGGSGCHAVLTGHTGLSTAKYFTDLKELEIGDCFYLHILDEVMAYEVNQVKVVEPENTKDLERVAGEDFVTLLTCTPYGVNSHRLLVRGKRIPYTVEQKENEEKKVQEMSLTREQKTLVISGISSFFTIIIITLVFYLHRRRKKYEN